MDIPKITDGELNVMRILWDQGELNASEIIRQLSESKKWNRNTTYTFINRLVEKGIIRRTDPNYICTPLYSQDEISVSETKSFIQKMYDGSISKLVASFMDMKYVSDDDLDELKKLVNKEKGGK